MGKATMPTSKRKSKLLHVLQNKWQLLVMFAIPLVWYIIFCYVPMYGIQIAFKDYNPVLGYLDSPWVGLKHFARFFSSYYSIDVIKNTLLISLYSLVFGFPVPILLAIIVNELRSTPLKKTLQNITYIPHFLSIVVVAGMLSLFLSPQYGVVNQVLGVFGVEPVAFLETHRWFRFVYVGSGIWQESGWNSIIYIAALAGIDGALYEAATIDGANRFQKIRHISIPSLIPTIVILLIMRMGQIMSVGFEKALLLQNDLNLQTSEIISTLVYKNGILKGNFSYAAAVGLMNSAINLILLLLGNKASKKIFDTSLW